MSGLVGKTIAEVVDNHLDYGGVDLIFTDGTGVRVTGNGHETDQVTVADLTPEDRERERLEKIERDEAQKLALAHRRLLEAEEADIKARLSKEAFERWMDANRPGWRFRNLLSELLGLAQYQRAFASLITRRNRMLHRQVFWQGGRIATIPIESKEDSDDLPAA